MNQTEIIQSKIMEMLEAGFTEKTDIYNETVKSLGVPRPTVRRSCRSLSQKLDTYLKVLKSEITNP